VIDEGDRAAAAVTISEQRPSGNRQTELGGDSHLEVLIDGLEFPTEKQAEKYGL
jgi:hypothetical protein